MRKTAGGIGFEASTILAALSDSPGHEPTIRYVSPRGWIKGTDYLAQGFHDSLRAFSKTRAGLVDTLGALDANGWSRRARFRGTTVGREATVLDYAKRIADHEARHLDQLRRTLG